ncbi:putative secreted protein with PEP-CTERM sorting signal [Pseudoduganella lurida]|uniref:Putative secreted protein with PEP-CTERM sorting signal n=1 Tax=Pseudoduganella lurida TaxID=1036180 RepID=A0A562R2B3_9BURK|nr:FxDxF family PEP-CTERM protein [Pseudoduganella lurida]TWI62600.1 putative secreted protein with PEP-CTERM sorting signal [Pseudoduganella lurida]
MNIKSLVAGAMLVAAGSVYADNLNTNVNLGGAAGGPLSGAFAVTHFTMGDFTDTFNLAPSSGFFSVDSSLITIGFLPTTDVSFYAADINGFALTLSPNGTTEWGTLSMAPIMGPLVLTVHGTIGDGGTGPAAASYAGTVNISPVPEPQTWGLLLLGLPMVGYLSRRRKSAAELQAA